MGRHKANEKLPPFVPMFVRTMRSDAWLSLPANAKALYPLLKSRLGVGIEKNGSVSLSVREAATYLRTGKDKAQAAFDDLQRRGFITPTALGALGVHGQGRATEWRLTEVGTLAQRSPTADFLAWKPGEDFEVKSRRKIQNPVPKGRQARPYRKDVG